ncbi:haloacid dehalogenase superfamily, subfamily IA, variant 3 with third motif having DD or ED [Rhodospirillales bacterium URHD0017]|nr:haloacid dehalogenase superfamily, subfamily IA, variant 3 with third motif having DD or ED [Rhodospirillales bacterium URHD0017]
MLRNPVEAVLFDMDGLLLDTEVIYIEAMQQAARSLSREMALDFCHSMVGVPEQECSLMIEAYYGDGFSIEEFRGRFYGLLRGLLEAGIPVKPGVVELLDFLANRGLPLAVATSSARKTAERHLGHAGLLDRFTALATRDDVERPKPHPDIYLEAARRLGVPPERCIAFEDSNLGLAAAHAAGTMAFMVPDLLQPLPETRARCLDVLPDLHAALKLLRQHL